MAAVKEYAAIAGMVFGQVTLAIMLLLSRFLFTHGVSYYAFVLYRLVVASLVIAPVAFYLNRKSRLCVRRENVKHIFLLALTGVTLNQTLHNAGIALTSSTFVSTMNNLIPAITFLLAYILRLEEVSIKTRDGQVKILGTMLGVGGAMVMTFFKYHDENPHPQQLRLNKESFPLSSMLELLGQSGSSFILGVFITIIGCLSYSVFLLYQAKVNEEYPCKLSLSFLINSMGTLQCTVAALLLEKPAALKLQWNIQLLIIVFCGICMGVGSFILISCVELKGAVFVAVFNPLTSVIVAILEPLLLHEQLTWSSLTGMAMVIVGLYLFIWAKADKETPSRSTQHEQDTREGLNTDDIEESSDREPLLPRN